MSYESLSSEIVLLRGIGYTSKARALSRINFPEAKANLDEGLRLIFKSLEIEPDNIGNKIMALRHIIGITIESPVKLHKEIIEIIKYIDNNLERIDLEELPYYFSTVGEYYLLFDKREIGYTYINNAINSSTNSDGSEAAKKILEKYSQD